MRRTVHGGRYTYDAVMRLLRHVSTTPAKPAATTTALAFTPSQEGSWQSNLLNLQAPLPASLPTCVVSVCEVAT